MIVITNFIIQYNFACLSLHVLKYLPFFRICLAMLLVSTREDLIKEVIFIAFDRSETYFPFIALVVLLGEVPIRCVLRRRFQVNMKKALGV